MMSLQCPPLCDIDINDSASLQLHYGYTHGQHRFPNVSALSAPSPQPDDPNAQSSLHVESNSFKTPPASNKTQPSAMTAADNPEFQLAPVQQQYTLQPLHQQSQQQAHFEAYLVNEYNDKIPAAPFNQRRFHPYYKQDFREAVYTLACDKCNTQFTSQQMLLHHINVAHASTVRHPDAHTYLFATGAAAAAKPESRAEILDLDSHTVHLYQPPNSRNTSPAKWPGEDKERFHNGGSSPEFGNVSTTTDTVPVDEPPSENRIAAKKGATKSANGTWKSNEARRPKTYNCSACNKWFTSSGHLKRHYNTTLHKNAVQQSGAPDPATLPIGAHYRPHKEINASVSPPVTANDSSDARSPPKHQSVDYRSGQPLSKLDPIEYRSAQLTPESELAEFRKSATVTRKQERTQYNGVQLPPEQESLGYQRSGNVAASFPKLSTGGASSALLQSTYAPHHASPSLPQWYESLPQQPQPSARQQRQPYLHHSHPLRSPSFFQQATPATLYPNFQSPHVSTTHQVTTTSSGGEDLSQPNGKTVPRSVVDDSKLPGFECIQLKGIAWYATTGRFLGTFGCGDVGGPEKREADVENSGKPALIATSSAPIANRRPVCTDEDESCEPRVSSTTEKGFSSISSNSESNEAGSAALFYSCDPCNKIFNRACYLTQHNKSFHSGDKPFKCGRCGKRFIDEYRLEMHTVKHAGDKPYKCDICPKAFNHKTDLRRHVCLHTNVRPYSCDICCKGFIRNDHMLKHRETHQNRKTFNYATRGRLIKVSQIKADMDAFKVTC